MKVELLLVKNFETQMRDYCVFNVQEFLSDVML